MTFKCNIFRLFVAGWLLASGTSEAATSCAISAGPTDFTAAYSSTTNVRVSKTVSVTCVTTSGTQNVNYTITPNHGLFPSGAQNQANFGANNLKYDFYTATNCTTNWSGVTGTMTARVAGRTQNTTFYGCVKPATPAPTAGYYGDSESFTLTITSPAGTTITGTNPWTFPVDLSVPTSCRIKTPPGNIDFGTYPAFSSSTLKAFAVLDVQCTASSLAITLDIGPTAGGVVPNTGLNYSLAINTTSIGGSNPLATTSGATGTRTFYINGTMPAGQAGTCANASCLGSDTRTLTVTY